MSSIPRLLLIAGGALLTLGLLFFLSDDRGRATRADHGAGGATPPGRADAAELAAPGAVSKKHVHPGATDSASRSEVQIEGEEAAQATGAFLRLIDRDGKSVLEEYSVKLIFGETSEFGRRLASKVSDEDGLIDIAEYAEGSPGDVEVLVFPFDCRLRFEPPALAIAELGRTAAQAPGLVVLARASARLRGRALDSKSGEPLAELALRVLSWEAARTEDEPATWVGISEWTRCDFQLEESAWMVTDAEGRFAAEETYPAGRLRLVTTHDEAAEVVLDGQGTSVEARFEVGPLLLLDFHPPGERAASDFIAGLHRDPTEAGLDEELHDRCSPWTPADWTHQWGNAAPVRPGPPPWTRLSADELAHPLPTFLILVSRDGAAKGVARIDEFERHRREPLFVEVLQIGVLAGEVLFLGTPSECELELWTPDATEEEGPLASRWLGSSDRTFQFQGLEPGRYRLELRAAGVEPRSLDVSVPAPGPLELVVPQASQELHALEGRITSASGLPLDGNDGRPGLQNIWASREGGSGNEYAAVTWSGGVGTFRIEGLPAGEYRLHPHFHAGELEIEPAKASARVPGAPATLHVRDDVALQRFELWITAPPPARDIAIEAQPEGRMRSIHSWVSANDPLEALPDSRPAQRVVLGPYPAGAVTSLALSGEGLRTARLGAGDFVVAGELWRAEVSLVAGWSMHFSVSDEARENLAGIVLALDGDPLPASDEGGAVQVDVETKPARLSVVTPGWELVEHHSWADWGTVFESGEFTLEQGFLDVFLRRTR